MKTRLMLVCLLTALVIGGGCISIPYTHDYGKAPHELRGAGVDNCWMNIDPWEQARLLRESDCNFTSIEFLGWPSVTGRNYWENPDPLKDKYEKYMKAMRAYRITVLVSIMNDNKGTGKYGDDGKSVSHYKTQIRRARDIVIGEGKEGVIIQPVGETRTGDGRVFEVETIQICAQRGFKTCYNRGSRPGTIDGCNYQAHHPFKTTDMGPVGCFVITDTGSILSILDTYANQGEPALMMMNGESTSLNELETLRLLNTGGLYGPANKAAVETHSRSVKQAGNRAYGYYGFGHKKIDKGAIEAVGKGWK
jgi:hypothetical protein